MNQIIKKLPLPIVGLMLALVALGNLVQSYGEIYRNIFGVLSAIILILVLIKIVKYSNAVNEALDNPVAASVFPTFSMGVMLLATYLKPLSSSIAFGMWTIGLVLHVALMISFTRKYVFDFNIKKVFPSWFIVYVGIAIGAITAPAFDKANIGQILFWFGFISYLVLLPIVLRRVYVVKDMAEPTLPTIIIFAAPAALCLAGYMNSFAEKNMIIVYLLLALSQLFYLFALTQLPKLLKLKFYPAYSAFTFPMVISAISLKLTNGFLIKSEQPIAFLKYLLKFEEIIAVAIVLYVLIRYISFLLAKPQTAK